MSAGLFLFSSLGFGSGLSRAFLPTEGYGLLVREKVEMVKP